MAAALGAVLRADGVPWPHEIEAALGARELGVPVLAAFTPELHSYDALIAANACRQSPRRRCSRLLYFHPDSILALPGGNRWVVMCLFNLY